MTNGEGLWAWLRPTEALSETWHRRDAAWIVAGCYALFALLVALLDDYGARVAATGDNGSYALEAATIRGLAPPGGVAAHFLGYPLLCAPVAALFGISDMQALPIVSVIGSAVAVGLVCELWGAWAAACFAVVNLDWVQRSLLGGADPVFAAFTFGALLMARRERWTLASFFGACATVVRPLGIFVLIALGVHLLRKKRFRDLALAVAIGAAMGAAYLGLVGALYGEGMANLIWYDDQGLGEDRTFIPFVTLFLSKPGHVVTFQNQLKAFVWMAFTALAIGAVFRRAALRRSASEHPVEWTFAAAYTGSFLFFPAWWIEGEYPRYFAPVIPLCLVALRPWLPQRRALVAAIGVASIALAAVEDMPWFRQKLGRGGRSRILDTVDLTLRHGLAGRSLGAPSRHRARIEFPEGSGTWSGGPPKG